MPGEQSFWRLMDLVLTAGKKPLLVFGEVIYLRADIGIRPCNLKNTALWIMP
jgi:hypothetical protein